MAARACSETAKVIIAMRLIQVLVIALGVLASDGLGAATARHALLVGNGAYTQLPLQNPVSDTNALAQVLREQGFEVTLVSNLDRKQFLSALFAFRRRLAPSSVALFYFAGHGAALEGKDYLLPVEQPGDLSASGYRRDGVDLGAVVRALEEGHALLRVVVIDACREPAGRWGIAPNTPNAALAIAPGTIVVQSTGPGAIAADGPETISPFAAAWVTQLRHADQDLMTLINQVGIDVLERTGGTQVVLTQSSPLTAIAREPGLFHNYRRSAPIALTLPALRY